MSDGLVPEEREAIADKYELDHLDKRIMALVVKFPGIDAGELAKKFRMTPAKVCLILDKPSFKLALGEYTMSTDALILKGQQQAVKVLINMLQDSNRALRLKAAQLLLTPKLTPKAATAGSTNNAVVFQTKIGTDGTLRQQISDADPDDPDIQMLKGEIKNG